MFNPARSAAWSFAACVLMFLNFASSPNPKGFESEQEARFAKTPPGKNGELKEVDPFLQRLVGNWRMQGRGRRNATADWYKTESTMEASLAVNGRAVVRTIDAPAIRMKAVDIVWKNDKTGEYTYIYLSSNNAEPVILTGRKTGDNSILMCTPDRKSRTEIRFVADGQMVARDYRVAMDADWMSRDVNHIRQAK